MTNADKNQIKRTLPATAILVFPSLEPDEDGLPYDVADTQYFATVKQHPSAASLETSALGANSRAPLYARVADLLRGAWPQASFRKALFSLKDLWPSCWE